MTGVCERCGASLPANGMNKLCSTCAIRAVLETATHASQAAAHAAAALDEDLPAIDDLRRLLPMLEVIELLGRGGMGAVYKAKQIALDRLVALKVLPRYPGREATFAERFAREARSLARLNHPNIVGIHDFGDTDGVFYFVMEYVDGANLRQAMRAGGVTPESALHIVAQVCDALQFAHDRGIVHRDIKPENLLLSSDGRVKIADFGLAKILTGDEGDPIARDRTLTATQQVMGTFHYMAPEQLEGAKHVDHRADIYSLGVTLYEMLTGELPLGRFALPSKKGTLDRRVDDVVLRSLEKSPDDRYQKASDFRGDLESLSRSAPSTLPPVSPDAVTAAPNFAVDRGRFAQLHPPRQNHWWLDRSLSSRRVLKTILDIAIVGLLICFVSFHSENAGFVNVFRVGFPDWWYQKIIGNVGSSIELNFLSWSFAAGIVDGLLIWLAIVIYRIERRQKTAASSSFGDEFETTRRSAVARYFYWAALPTLVCWGIGPVGYFMLLASLEPNDGGRPTWLAVFLFVVLLGILLPAFFHFLWLLFGGVGEENAKSQARRAGHWMFGLGVAMALYGAVAAIGGVVAMQSRDSTIRLSAIFGLLWGTFVFACFGVLAMRGGYFLARFKDSIETRVAAVLYLLPATPLWILSLPVAILVLRTLGRAEVQSVLETDRSSRFD